MMCRASLGLTSRFTLCISVPVSLDVTFVIPSSQFDLKLDKYLKCRRTVLMIKAFPKMQEISKVLQSVMLSQSQVKPLIHAEKVLQAYSPPTVRRTVPFRVVSLCSHGAWSPSEGAEGKGLQSHSLLRATGSSSHSSYPMAVRAAGKGYEVEPLE